MIVAMLLHKNDIKEEGQVVVMPLDQDSHPLLRSFYSQLTLLPSVKS